MKTGLKILICMAGLVGASAPVVQADEAGAAMAGAVSHYIGNVMEGLGAVADRHPTVETFREQMKPFVAATPGVFGATLIDTNFVIRQVYFKRDFLAVGFDLKKVGALDYFWERMREQPAPQLSEPGHGSLIQPRLVAMRYPFMADGRLAGIVSVMIHTDTFLKAVGLDACSAFTITCRGALAEKKGELGDAYSEAALQLPSTDWVIRFRK